MKVTEMVRRVAEVLQDTSNITWTNDQVKNWLHDAELAVCFVRPDAYSALVALQLVTGTRQSLLNVGGGDPLPSRLLDVVRVVSPGGAPANAVQRISRGHLDRINPAWHADTPVANPSEYCYDDRTPRDFYVNPPSDGTQKIEVLYSAIPPAYDLQDPAQVTAVSDIYVPALIDWALYRCFCRDSDQTPNWQRGQAHMQSFLNIMGIKANSDTATSLKQGAHLN